ncbi:prepilin-type N-terminal cleavage/methylation domain-containing protein [Megalodesulfovibrio gigas]|uniref:Prepilin-type N-terminal cleavage/methylation domain-containing protein n=1 Tax=Megalodesulfovibrio gigas (strain ATCC 19364 / DSM 1382 / NCIMB 9332 / VKM B-1759) TaxID=1121448 RepID=T2GG61_MEGG1|nr:prepilin-type N-terminal cleavage/methylation domain-containing protein [Megalodesulfovibrio gigas]AGW15214.1 hypothetical protein DGI_4000 [Megalodesulfovibrio gigas DSM 1382 = ATCC 19364]
MVIPGCSQFRKTTSGFSLLEVLVALVVGAILTVSLLGVIQQNVTMAGEVWEMQAHLDMAQELLLLRSPYARQLAPSSWAGWTSKTPGAAKDRQDWQDARWRLTRERRKETGFRHGFEDGPRNATPFTPTQLQLFTSIRTRQMRWTWLEPPAETDTVRAAGKDTTPEIPMDDIPMDDTP